MDQQSTILGIPVQAALDTLLFIINGDVHDSVVVTHCTGILYIAEDTFINGELTSAGNPCYPVDNNLRNTWKCTAYETAAAGTHHGCGRENLKLATYFCECGLSPRGQAYLVEGVLVQPYYYTSSTDGTYRCGGCANGHKSIPPCPMCGEVH